MHSIGLAFRRGELSNFGDRVVMDATGGPFVHAELFLRKGQNTRFYGMIDLGGTCQAGGCFMPTRRALPLPDNWHAVSMPITPECYKTAYALVLQLISMQLPYNSRDLWQCCIKLMLPFERDLDCLNLEGWRAHGVFCSQVCLLVLRRLAMQGALALPLDVAAKVAATNSRGCSPNSLFQIITTAKKRDESRGARRRAVCTQALPAR